jgi:hypothetical protein
MMPVRWLTSRSRTRCSVLPDRTTETEAVEDMIAKYKARIALLEAEHN